MIRSHWAGIEVVQYWAIGASIAGFSSRMDNKEFLRKQCRYQLMNGSVGNYGNLNHAPNAVNASNG